MRRHKKIKDKRKPYISKKMLYPKWCILQHQEAPTSCILALPGRGQSGFSMAGIYNAIGLPQTMVIGVTPSKYEWYPMPNGVFDQRAATASLSWSVDTINDIVSEIQKKYGIGSNRIAIAGYSAGAVMAIHTAIHSPYTFPAIMIHAGAILEPWKLPPCTKPDTEFMLFHSIDDTSFEWVERYCPMRDAMKNQGYKTQTIEKYEGGHGLFFSDVRKGATFAGQKFGYSEELLCQI